MKSFQFVLWLRLSAAPTHDGEECCLSSDPKQRDRRWPTLRQFDRSPSLGCLSPSELHNLVLNWRPARIRALSGTVELPGNQPAVPRKYCIRSGDAGDLFQSLTAQSLANFGERESLRIRHAQPSRQMRSQDAFLSSQVLVLQQQLLVYEPSYICQQPRPLCCPSCKLFIIAGPTVAGASNILTMRDLDSAGDAIDFMLSPKRDLTAAKLFLRLALSGTGGVRPRVVNVDGHPAYARAIAELKQSGELGRRCRCRPSPYLNNIIEQDHRFIKKRITASLGFRSAEGAWRTIDGYEAMHVIRKGQIRWLAKGDVVGQRQFIHTLFGLAT